MSKDDRKREPTLAEQLRELSSPTHQAKLKTERHQKIVRKVSEEMRDHARANALVGSRSCTRLFSRWDFLDNDTIELVSGLVTERLRQDGFEVKIWEYGDRLDAFVKVAVEVRW